MTNESINDKLKKLITKVNSIQGSLLSMGKRLTALEDSEKDYYPSDPNTALIHRVTKIWDYLGGDGWKDEEVEADKEELLSREEVEETDIIDEETLDALDEIIEAE